MDTDVLTKRQQLRLPRKARQNLRRKMGEERKVDPAARNNMPEVIRPQVMETRHLIEPENLRWFVLRCESQKEETLIHVLDLHGIPAAIPTIPKERVRRGRLFRWRAPVAAGYVLIGFPGREPIQWHEITRFRIVYDVVRYANTGNPVQVPWACAYDDKGAIRDGGVKTLLADLEAVRIGAAKYMRARPALSANDQVSVQDGPLTGFEGKVQGFVGSAAIVLLNILGRQTPVQIPVENIVRAA